jgi:cytochrome c oxidase subunit 2
MPWILGLLLRMATFIAAVIWSAAIAPALPVHEIQVEARKFAFEPAVIMVTAGEPVRLVIHARDATHGFSIKELSFHLEIPRSSEAVTAEFTAPPPGRYEIACSEFCGRGHRHMKAVLVSVAAGPSNH